MTQVRHLAHAAQQARDYIGTEYDFDEVHDIEVEVTVAPAAR